MFQIKYDTIFLDLADNQECEIERNSPLFLIDSFFAEFSTPVSIPYSDKNARVLGFYFFEPTQRTRKKFPVQVFDNGTYKCNGMLVLESAGMNSVHASASTASGYLLIGISDFLQTIQTKKLTDLKLGGPRAFPFTSFDLTDSSSGWWQHLHATWEGDVNSFDYVLPTVRNEAWTGSVDDPFATGYMNALDTETNSYTTLKQDKPVSVFTYLKYVLQCIFSENGWTVDFSGINDTGWEKLILFSAKSLEITETTYEWDDYTFTLKAVTVPKANLIIRLAEFMPQDYTCAELITAICIRYGWAPLVSITQKSCTFVALKEINNWEKRNWTKYAGAGTGSEITIDKKVYAFKNTFEGNDNFPSAPDMTGWTIGDAVDTLADLPSPFTNAYDTVLIFVYDENQYYKVGLNEEETARIWIPFSDNIYDEDSPEGTDATDTYETKCTTLPVYRTIFRTASSVDYYAWFPLCEQSRTEKFGIRTLFYHGMVKEVNVEGSGGSFYYPYASNYHLNHFDDTQLPWSNVYKHKNASGTDYGIINYWYSKWMDKLESVENTVKKKFYLPLHELMRFRWNNIILDKNISYLVKQVIEPLPYKGYIECTCQRLKSGNEEKSAQGIYLKLTYENIVTGQTFTWSFLGAEYNYDDATTADIMVRAYADAAGTIPIALDNFKFKFKNTVLKSGVFYSEQTVEFTLDGSERNINYAMFGVTEYDYSDNVDLGPPDGHYKNVYTLLPDSSYEIII